MSRGRRGGRRQRRREEQARQAQEQEGAKKTNGQSGPAAVVLPTPPAPVESVHPRPISARELVARLENLRAQEQAADESAQAYATAAGDTDAAPGSAIGPAAIGPAGTGQDAGRPAAPMAEPRRFQARGDAWIATHAGRGAGGTGRVAHARLEAIRFATIAEPEHIVGEVLAPHARLNDLYDDELAALLEQALRYRKEDG